MWNFSPLNPRFFFPPPGFRDVEKSDTAGVHTRLLEKLLGFEASSEKFAYFVFATEIDLVHSG